MNLEVYKYIDREQNLFYTFQATSLLCRNWLKILILCSVLLLGCAKTDKQINLLNQVGYKLADDEKIVPITGKIKDEYSLLFSGSNFQIPLYRCVSGENYTTYIAIPFQTSFDDIVNHYILNPDSCDVFTDEHQDSLFYRTYKCKDQNIAEFVFKSHNNFYSIITQTNSASILSTKFTKQQFLKRITTNEN